jgi:DNA-binding NtrC family response regulator
VAGADLGRAFDVQRASAVVGRAEGADIRLADPTVSQFHAELHSGFDRITVVDLGSTNGTRVGDTLLERGAVPSGAMVTVGSSVLRVELASALRTEASRSMSFGSLVGTSAPMRELFAVLERLARTDLGVLLEGETGTGKEVAARAIHEKSRRASGPFVALDCTTIPPTLAESVLFGHERGAFTGASERRVGIFEAASGGTILLDEIGDLPIDLQPKLLRVLERREFVAVGSTRPKPIDVRIVSATWRDLRMMVNQNLFREDLYQRIVQARVRLPTLGERRDDIGPLVQHFLAKIPWDVTAARSIAPDALAVLAARTYTGNMRELKHTVERVAMLAEGSTITGADLAFERMLAGESRSSQATDTPRTSQPPPRGEDIEAYKDAKRTVIDEFERGYLARLLERAGTNLSKAARLARVDRQTLRELLVKHGLRAEE